MNLKGWSNMEQITPAPPETTPDVLVVDDTPANLQLLTGMLKKHGYRVRPVPSGRLAIQAVRKIKPDLILLDINMPDMNGYEVCEYFKADAALKDIPVIFISALDETIDKIKAFSAGGVDYITKPFQFNEVEARVQTHLKLRGIQVELELRNSQLQTSFEEVKKLEELQNNLTHMIIHDMRSPLLGVTGFLEILALKGGKTMTSNDLAILSGARSSALVLVDMVNSLLDVCRLEQGQMPLNLGILDLDVLIGNALASLGSLTGKVSLHYQKPTLATLVKCDANLITRVIANLVGNSIKYTPKDGQVTVSFEDIGDGTVKLWVSDTGSGILHEYHQKIFDKFGQVKTQHSNTRYSTGLGLAFCKLAVEAHGGKIGVESEIGKGSTFWIILPHEGSP
jgi:signal transduction histidine kinase